ncbi:MULTISPECIES: polysaccharide pyruvyl transferase family protein [Pseudomonas]|jgi:hypothetical protein|uniref:Polysaccharide pyruvyl transferase family protein n=2 Tax=Pseudomonas TaxID=286 RepID=A0A4Y9TRV8_PSEFL|nr:MULTISPECIES: polysaccharide pyruvyl transferase family protein [Pseudomonas]MCX9149499.1 polysaccharide pyruvyl transferase family protein [Pseudomonas sp. TB1-B1]QXH65821.1 polysaccharide pyruvyl transferase family protein [Pseudomonas asgharzadehiana]TFW45126.1 polysaccharide pyruvyl transferase family protein [Pseudomonas fluorescens]
MSRAWQVGIFGTFDVANYGDLLFPIIAEVELTRRLGAVKLHRFSYHAKTPPEWPYEVTSLTALPDIAGELDGVLIGGGFIIRFDKVVATGYYPPDASIHHPTGYWLTPALIALQHAIPLIWNAPGMHCNEIPSWAVPLVKLSLDHSPHIRVRDALSQSALAQVSPTAQVEVLPDTAFGLARLLDVQAPSAAFLALRASAGLTQPYLVVHAMWGLDSFLHLWRTHAGLFEDLQLLLLPIGPVLGDHESVLGEGLERSRCLPFWPDPLLLAELLAHAEGVIGHSYHLAISSLVFGVPIFCSADLGTGKYTALPSHGRIFQIRRDQPIEPQWFRAQLGRQPLSQVTAHATEQLDAHWDRVAELIREGPRSTPAALNRYWQGLPGVLEDLHAQVQHQVAERQSDHAQHQHALEALYRSNSFKLTAPLRHIRRTLTKWLGALRHD